MFSLFFWVLTYLPFQIHRPPDAWGHVGVAAMDDGVAEKENAPKVDLALHLGRGHLGVKGLLNNILIHLNVPGASRAAMVVT